MKLILVILFFASSVCAAPVQEAPSCAMRFSAAIRSDGTADLIAYLKDLHDGQILTLEHLTRFKNGLEKGELQNPITLEEAHASSKLQIQRDVIQDHLDHSALAVEKLLSWVSAKVKQKDRVRVLRVKTSVDTKRPDYKIELHPFSPARFKMGEKTATQIVAVTLTHPFEMMSAPVTQANWVEIMGENPSYFITGEESVTRLIHGKKIRMLPDHPVENVTWWSVLEYANRLSRKYGLKPVYDLSGYNFKSGTSPEDGTYVTELDSNDQITKRNAFGGYGYSEERLIDAPNGNVYETEGFRLPTEAEWEYVAMHLRKANRKYAFGNDSPELAKYIWDQSNSRWRTHTIEEKLPFIIETSAGPKEFYGLLGNVWEWSQDWSSDGLLGGIDPQKPLPASLSRTCRGGSWKESSAGLVHPFRSSFFPTDRKPTIGFRLARTLRVLK